MEWLKSYYKELEKTQKEEKTSIRNKILEDVKKKYISDLNQEIENVKKRLNFLEKEMESCK
jgi:hypothetical protein